MSVSEAAAAFSVQRGDNTPLVSPSDLPPAEHFIDGEFRSGSRGETADVIDPSNESTFAQVISGTAEDVDQAVAAAIRAKRHWGSRTPKQRAEILLAIADRLEENSELFVKLESADAGKPLMVSRDDVGQSVDTFRFMAGAARAITSQAAADYAEDHLSVIIREPLGVVGAITPWNYPLLMGVWKIAPILAAGNTMIIKPAEQTPLTTLKFAELVADLLPPGVFNVVTGRGSVVGARLAEHPDIDMIALTGSVASGRAVTRSAAETLKRIHLELGGKAPVVIFPDADLAGAASSLRAAGYWNSGQECGSGCRALVHHSVASEFIEHLTREVGTLALGEPAAGDNIEVGPLVSQAHFDSVAGFLERARGEGIRAAVGGSPIEDKGYFIPPTVLVDVPAGAEVAREEIFGPVVTVETFTDENEAIARANDVPYGLAASVWTENARRSIEVSSQLDFGTVWVNSHLILASEAPWGGFKGSGYGRDLSIYAIDDYSRTKHVMHNHGR
jgi:aminobutyraldehyde dehydrogenase